MLNKKFKILFSGKLATGYDPIQVKRDIKARFKVDDRLINILLSGKPLVIKKDLNYQTALKYCSILKDIGLLCKIQNMEPIGKPEKAEIPFEKKQTQKQDNQRYKTIICPKCRHKQEMGINCIHCGVNIQEYYANINMLIKNVKENITETSAIKEKHFQSYIGPNADRYIKNFHKFQVGSTDTFELTWNWSSFLFGPSWLLYRKMNKWAILTYFCYAIPFLSFICAIILGVTGYYLYYLHAKGKIITIQKKYPSSEISEILSNLGGVYNIYFVVFLTLLIITLLYAISFIMKHLS